jgi:hypothetical protein
VNNTSTQIQISGDTITATLGKTSITVSRDIDHAKLADRIATMRNSPEIRLGWDDGHEIVDRPLAIRQEEACLLSILLALGGVDRPSQWVAWCFEAIDEVAREGGDVRGLGELVESAHTLSDLRKAHEIINQLRAKARRLRLAAIVAATAPGVAIGDGDDGSIHGAWGASL